MYFKNIYNVLDRFIIDLRCLFFCSIVAIVLELLGHIYIGLIKWTGRWDYHIGCSLVSTYTECSKTFKLWTSYLMYIINCIIALWRRLANDVDWYNVHNIVLILYKLYIRVMYQIWDYQNNIIPIEIVLLISRSIITIY